MSLCLCFLAVISGTLVQPATSALSDTRDWLSSLLPSVLYKTARRQKQERYKWVQSPNRFVCHRIDAVVTSHYYHNQSADLMTRHEPDLVGSKKSNGVQIGGETAFERDVDLDSRSEWLVEYLGGPVDAESDTETLVFGGNYDKVWKLQPSERLWPLF